MFRQLAEAPQTAFKSLGRLSITFIGIVAILLVGILDYFTGYEFSFSIFYLLPVIFVAWYAERSDAIIISVFAAITWVAADLISGHRYSRLIILISNAVMTLGIFTIVSFFLATIKRLLISERELSRKDFLTGVSNSRSFYESASREIERAIRYGRSLTIAYIDIDNFKSVNDSFGHQEGDNLLNNVAQTILKNIRSNDIVSRLGGDEFVIMLSETGSEEARIAVEKIHLKLMALNDGNQWNISFSIGVISWNVPSGEIGDMIQMADNLMYSVKFSGKNTVRYIVFDESGNYEI